MDRRVGPVGYGSLERLKSPNVAHPICTTDQGSIRSLNLSWDQDPVGPRTKVVTCSADHAM